MRPLAVLLACLGFAACGPSETRVQPPSDAELRLLAYLARDPFVTIERTERDGDGHLLVITSQGRATRRYLIAPDDPARPDLRLRRLEDDCTLMTAPNDQVGALPVLR